MKKRGNQDDAYKGIKVAVLGASGFIGRWVALALYKQGADVSLIVRNSEFARRVFSQYNIHGEVFEINLLDTKNTINVFETIRPSITFNLVGYGVDHSECEEEKAYQINASLVKIIGEGVAISRDRKWRGQELVHTGSALEYGTAIGNLSEESTPNPTSLYGRSKLAGTRFLTDCCKTYGIKGVTARLFTVYGPGEYSGRLLPSLLEAARTQTSLRLSSGGQKRDFTYVEDVAEGLLRLGVATAKPGEILNLATGRLTTVRSFVETAAGILRISSDRLGFGKIPTRVEEMEHEEVSVERLRQLVAWIPPTGITEGIIKTRDFEALLGDKHSLNG